MKALRIVGIVIMSLVFLWRIDLAYISHSLAAASHRAEEQYAMMADPFAMVEFETARRLTGGYSLAVANSLGCALWTGIIAVGYCTVWLSARAVRRWRSKEV
jgi:hypothetical protein